MFVCTEVDTTPGFYTAPGNHRSSCLSIKSFQARNHTCQNLGVWPSEAEQSLDRAIGRIRFLQRVDFGRRGMYAVTYSGQENVVTPVTLLIQVFLSTLIREL